MWSTISEHNLMMASRSLYIDPFITATPGAYIYTRSNIHIYINKYI